jgi:hypothetical protein
MSKQVQVQTRNTAQPSFTPANVDLLQRKCACGQHDSAGGECEKCRKEREGTLQRTAVTAAPSNSIPSIVPDVLSSPGQPLETHTRSFMESRFGQDFSQVRIHTDARASESACSVHALAYTVGQDVVFGAGQYTPETNVGRRLLAHELTHTIQQSQGQIVGMSMRSAMQVNEPGDSYEQEADRTAEAVVSGASTSPGEAISATSSPTLQRAPDNEPATPPKIRGRRVLRSTTGTILIAEVWQEGDDIQQWLHRAELFYLRWRFGNVSPQLHAQLLKILEEYPFTQRKNVSPVVGETYGYELGIGLERRLVRLYNRSVQTQTPPENPETVPDPAKEVKDKVAEKTSPSPEETGTTKEEKTEEGTKEGTKPPAQQEEELPSEVRDFYAGAETSEGQQIPARELLRMYKIYAQFIQGNPKWVKEGESFKAWVDFLDKNAKQLQGKLRTSETGKLQLETLQRLREKLDKGEVLEFPEEEEKELTKKAQQAKLKEGITEQSGSPEWLLLPAQDRKFLLEVMEKHPDLFKDAVGTSEGDTKRLTVGMKRTLALQIAAKYLPGEVGQSLLNMAKDPSFWLSLAEIIAIYVALWLSPEPASKVIATALTAYLLTKVGFDLLIVCAKAWSRLNDNCKYDARTGAELEEVAKQFAKDLGPAGATVVLLIAFWLIGRAVGEIVPRAEPPPETTGTIGGTGGTAGTGATGGNVIPLRPGVTEPVAPRPSTGATGPGADVIPIRPGVGEPAVPRATAGTASTDVPASRFEGNLAVKPEVAPEAAPQSAPRPQLRAVPEPKPEIQPGVKPEAIPEIKPEPKPTEVPQPEGAQAVLTGQKPSTGQMAGAAAAASTKASALAQEDEEEQDKCKRLRSDAVPIRWPPPLWQGRPAVRGPDGRGDPGSYDATYDLPDSALLIKRGSTFYNPDRPEIGRYINRIENPPFNITIPSGFPIHHKFPLYLGGPGNEEIAEGEYDPEGRTLISPNLVVMTPQVHKDWHNFLANQPLGPRRGQGPSERTPDGTAFCVLNLM